MRTKNGFRLQEICGQYVLIAEGMENLDFSNIVSMNETAATMWNGVQGKDFTVEDMANILTENYQIDENTPLPMDRALADAKAVVEQWRKAEILAE